MSRNKKPAWAIFLFFILTLCFGSHGSAHAIEYHGSLIEQTLSERGFDTDAINLAQSMSFLNDLGQQSLGSGLEGHLNFMVGESVSGMDFVRKNAPL